MISVKTTAGSIHQRSGSHRISEQTISAADQREHERDEPGLEVIDPPPRGRLRRQPIAPLERDTLVERERQADRFVDEREEDDIQRQREDERGARQRARRTRAARRSRR